MAKQIDFKWLKGQARDDLSQRLIDEIARWRQFTLENNLFVEGDELFCLHLGKYQLWFRKSGAFSSVEVYCEIFRENSHFLLPGFSGRDAEIVIDIGANEGFYALKIKESNPDCKIFCLEPNPYAYQVLKKNIETNGLQDVTLINKAVGPENGEIALQVVKEIAAIGSKDLRIVQRRWLKEEFITNIKVEAITLDKLFSEYDIKQVDILKIDTEGMEQEILVGSGDVLRKVKKIIIERHNLSLRNWVVDFLGGENFEVLFEEDPGFERYYGDIYLANKGFSLCNIFKESK